MPSATPLTTTGRRRSKGDAGLTHVILTLYTRRARQHTALVVLPDSAGEVSYSKTSIWVMTNLPSFAS